MVGNIFSLKKNSPMEDWLCLSNGAADVLIDVLVLSGSALAQTDGEKRLIVWLGEKDQAQVGGGTIGFDMAEMPWQRESFETDKAFLRRTVRAAQGRLGWEKLGYLPEYSSVFANLGRFDALLEKMTPEDMEEEALPEWLCAAREDDPVNRGFPRCEKHGVLLTCFGCRFCNAAAGSGEEQGDSI